FGQFGEVCRCAETVSRRRLNLGCGNAEDVGAAGGDLDDLAFIDIETRYLEAGFGEKKTERQANVAQTDDSNAGVTGLQTSEPVGCNPWEDESVGVRHMRLLLHPATTQGHQFATKVAVGFQTETARQRVLSM